MKKRVYFWVIVLSGMLLGGCVSPKVPRVEAMPQPEYADGSSLPCEIIPVGYFDRVVISGPVSVVVNGQKPNNQLRVSGTIEAIKDFSAENRQGTLYIDAGQPVGVSLDVDHAIQQITVKGHGRVTFNNLDKQSTKVILGGNSVTNMRGELVLSRIELSGNAVLHAYWIDSSNLHIVTKDNAKLFLAGVVSKLDIIASGHSEIDGKSLRAEEAYARTSDDANVGVTVKRALGSLSSDHSTLYYYRDSHVGMMYLNGGGSALRMVGIPPFYVQ